MLNKKKQNRNGAIFLFIFIFWEICCVNKWLRSNISWNSVQWEQQSDGSWSCGILCGAQHFSLFRYSFFLSVSIPLSHSLSLSLILLHENNRASLSTGTVIQLQTCPCYFHTLHSAFLSMSSCHRLILLLKFPHCSFQYARIIFFL